MPRGDKSKYSSRQQRKAEHIEEGYEKRGVASKEAARRAWATVNKQEGGGKRGGSASKRGSSTSSKGRSSSSGKKSTSRSRASTRAKSSSSRR